MISDRLRCVWQQGEVKETDNLMHYNVVYKGSNPSCSMAVISLTMRLETQHAQPIVTMIETGNTIIEKYDGNPATIGSLDIAPTLPSRLNKLKRTSPEAYYYWAKTSHLLQQL